MERGRGASVPRKRGGWSAVVEYFVGGGERFPSRYRALEVVFCGAYSYTAFLLAQEVYLGASAEPLVLLILPIAALFAFLTADLLSGLVHWAADTYGTRNTPFFGPKFIAPFREHHVDPLAITRHDFVEANGDNCFCALTFIVPTYLFVPARAEPWGVVAGLFVLLVSLSVVLTSVAHGWAHAGEEAPRIAKWMQRMGFLISSEHHAMHHVTPHKTHYCITNGWLNPILDRTRFFRRVERIVDGLGVTRAEHD